MLHELAGVRRRSDARSNVNWLCASRAAEARVNELYSGGQCPRQSRMAGHLPRDWPSQSGSVRGSCYWLYQEMDLQSHIDLPFSTNTF